MLYNKLGKTDISISYMALGCWALISDLTWGKQDENDSIATIYAALDHGINFFDTAEMYRNGCSESLLGKALKNHRNGCIIASKVSSTPMKKDVVKNACEKSLKRLRTDYIDLYQIHWIDRSVPLSDTMEAFDELKKEGKILAIGVCNGNRGDISSLTNLVQLETDQLPYSLLWRAIEYDIYDKCIEKDIGILCYSSLAQGLLTGKFNSADDVPDGRARTRHFSRKRPNAKHGEDGCEKETFEAIANIRSICKEINETMANVSLARVSQKRGVNSVLVGARNPEQIKKNVKALDLKLSDEVISTLSKVTEKVKEILGPNADMWQSDSRFM